MVHPETLNFYHWPFKMTLVFNVFLFKMINISSGFHFKRKWSWKDKVTSPSSCTGFSEREKGMSRKWGRMLRERTASKLGPSPFHLKSFLSPIHSFRSFVGLTNHYNRTRFNGRNVNSLSSCPHNPHVWSIPQSIRGSFDVLLCAPVALEARHLAHNKPQFPAAACLLLLPSSL